MISPGDQAEKRLQKRLQRRLRHRVSSDFIGKISLGVPKGIRTPVAAVKGRCPRPLDDGDIAEGAI